MDVPAASEVYRLNSTLESLELFKTHLDISSHGEKIIAAFEEDPRLPGIILLQNNEYYGMFSRIHFFERLSQPFGQELFKRRPIQLLYDLLHTSTLVLPGSCTIATAVTTILRRAREHVFDPVVVKIAEHQFGLLDINQLFLAHSQIHEIALSFLQTSQHDLAKEKELAQITLKSIGDGVITTDTEGIITSINDSAQTLTGSTEAKSIGQPIRHIFQLVETVSKKIIHYDIQDLVKKNSLHKPHEPMQIIGANADYRFIQISTKPITHNVEDVGFVLVFRDITPEIELFQQLERQAKYDELTNLLTRREFMQILDDATQEAKIHRVEHVLLCLDLDRFKIINDTCGHCAGDELLRQISQLLQQNVRATDKVARLGGDEFSILLRYVSIDEALITAHRIRQQIQNIRFIWEDKCFTIGTCIGLAQINHSISDVNASLREADSACFWAKRQGRNRVHIFSRGDFYEEHQDAPLISQITQALEHDNFQLFFQPIVPVLPPKGYSSQFPQKYEVLVRMVDGNGNLIPPGAFISTAERYNLMQNIDRWVIETLFATQGEFYRRLWSQYQKMGQPCPCIYSINLSGDSINDESLVSFIKAQLEQYQIPSELICFEVTETVAITSLTKATQLMQEIKALGCHFALDDFGSGMSSFGYLKNLPVDYVKIDGSFIQEMSHDPIAYAMVEAIHRIGQLMGIQTVAEWVDDPEIVNRLSDIGVNYMQGYLISAPKILEPHHILEAPQLNSHEEPNGNDIQIRHPDAMI